MASKLPSTWNPSAPMPHTLTLCPKVPQGLLSVGLRAWGTLPTPQPTEASSSLTDHKVPTSLCPPDLLPTPKYAQHQQPLGASRPHHPRDRAKGLTGHPGLQSGTGAQEGSRTSAPHSCRTVTPRGGEVPWRRAYLSHSWQRMLS